MIKKIRKRQPNETETQRRYRFDEHGIHISEQDKELQKLADLRSQLVEARREKQKIEEEQKRISDIRSLERERIESHPLYAESSIIVENAHLRSSVRHHMLTSRERIETTQKSIRETLRKIYYSQKSKSTRDIQEDELISHMAAIRVQAWRKKLEHTPHLL